MVTSFWVPNLWGPRRVIARILRIHTAYHCKKHYSCRQRLASFISLCFEAFLRGKKKVTQKSYPSVRLSMRFQVSEAKSFVGFSWNLVKEAFHNKLLSKHAFRKHRPNGGHKYITWSIWMKFGKYDSHIMPLENWEFRENGYRQRHTLGCK